MSITYFSVKANSSAALADPSAPISQIDSIIKNRPSDSYTSSFTPMIVRSQARTASKPPNTIPARGQRSRESGDPPRQSCGFVGDPRERASVPSASQAQPLVRREKFVAKERPSLDMPSSDMTENTKKNALSGRYTWLAVLCALLIGSGYYAAYNKNLSSMVNVPINITRSSETDTTKSQPPETKDGGIISDIPNMKPTDVTISSFDTYREQVNAQRGEVIAMLDELINNSATSQATLADAQSQKLSLAKSMSAESELEGLIAARGFGEAYVTVSYGAVNVVVRNTSLTQDQIATITEMAATQTGEPADNVRVILSE
ncbi:MAG: SpoIIIAH-like family protein [Oscillospiraceae bacterium]|jgi:hypothetical protein|nr:SpoIIIAH-like family protein [Oscillospiraceae bacterium]